jgi:hypothetical protein
MPVEGVTSLIAEGLSESGMDYDDLILSLFADRLDFLLTHRRETVRHVVDLLHAQPRAGLGGRLEITADTVAGTATQTYRQVVAAAASAAEDMALVNDLTAKASATSAGAEVVAQINEIVTNQSLRALDALPRPVSLDQSRLTQSRARESL